MNRDAWERRQAQWRRFHEWEARQPAGSALSPSERLAEIGALVDLALSRAMVCQEGRDVNATARGIQVMRARLAVLRRAA